MTTSNITSGTDFIGKTLIIGSTGTSNSDYARVVEFNNNTTGTYLGVMFSATNKQPWFTFRPLGQTYTEPVMPWISYINVYYIYVFSFVSDIQVKYNIYEYNGASTIISKGTIGTYTAASAFLQNLTQFWLGRNVWNNDFYSGTYSKVALYNGDLLALSEANILSTLLTLVTSTQTNIINNATTYTFRALGTNFLGVVVNILNYNTTTGSTVTTSAITLNGTDSTSGGYLNIIGSYLEPPPNIPTNIPTSELGSIYATTISSKKYIVIASQNIELSGNVIIKNDATLSSGLLNTNSLIPNVTNSASLGSTGKIWSNAYINDVSINNNLQVTGNVYINGNLEASNIYTKSQFDNSYANVYTRRAIDLSFANVYTRGYIDQSFANVYTRGYIDQSFANVYTRGIIDQSFQNVYTRTQVDLSFANVYTRGIIDQSFQNVYTRGAIDQSFANVYTRGQIDNSFANVYTISRVDLSFANVYTRGRIDQSFANVYTKSQVDASFVTKSLFELSYNALVAIRGTASGSGGTSVNSNIIPSSTNSYDLGSTTKYWNNAYINNLRVSNRVYQEISGDISWSAVNGYYGLAKDAYPGLNPYSSGDLAVSSWRRITTNSTVSNSQWNDVCWCPELRLFVAVGVKNTGSSAVITSNDGITWTPATITDTSITSTQWQTICWSPQLRLFVAGGAYSDLKLMYSTNGTSWNPLPNSGVGTNILHMCWSPELSLFVAITIGGPRVATSSNGYNWTERYLSYPLNQSNWEAVCWSPELGLFVAVAYNEIKVMISRNGIDWTRVDIDASVFGGQWTSITWSSQLGIFVAVSKFTGGTSARVMTSRDAITWVLSSDIPESAAHTWSSVCWSPELKIFIGTLNYAWSGSYRILTSVNGINWKFIPVGTPTISDVVRKVKWSPELGLFIALGDGAGSNQINISSLKGRPPTSYNVFDSSFNSIDETGKWTFQNMAVTTLNVTGTFTNSSDDRLKHNEVIITNGLDVIDRLNPKFYQKTQVMLDASYNGDLSGHAWTYEAGLIAQELLQIPDLSFAVCGGDYYHESYNYYDTSINYYDTSSNYINRANYDISYNLITQPYSLNYNSIYVYVFAAIKELHAKVKAQETAIYNRQAIINNCITRIETLEQRNQV
uniref:Peptidase S74 domain-containing protein n=1 Tax=viral metagenome TaxID=1070528 RepID=A0A6C0D6N0_9ZZZZ